MTAGPFGTERQATEAARAHPAWSGPTAALNHQILREALDEADVELGAWDRQIIEWLAMWEPATCAVIAGLIIRAHRPAGPVPVVPSPVADGPPGPASQHREEER